MLKPRFSKSARRQLSILSKSNPTLLDDVITAVAKLVYEPFTGSHRPKPLKGTLQGCWSVRLNIKDRLVYQVKDNELLILSVEGHY